jgi:hypothetical protein
MKMIEWEIFRRGKTPLIPCRAELWLSGWLGALAPPLEYTANARELRLRIVQQGLCALDGVDTR